MLDVLKGRPRGRPIRFTVGISDLIPKLIAYRILEPVFRLADPVQLVCYEDQPERLLLELSAHNLDLVLTHMPGQFHCRIRVFNHRLGSCGVSLFATAGIAARYRKNFPARLDGAPFLVPIERSASRRALEQWFAEHKIRPLIVGEFQDSALMNAFGQGLPASLPLPARSRRKCDRFTAWL